MKFIKALVFHKRNWPKANKFLYSCNYISIKFPLENKKTTFFSANRFNLLSIYERDYANGNQDLLSWCKKILCYVYAFIMTCNISFRFVFTMAQIPYYMGHPHI